MKFFFNLTFNLIYFFNLVTLVNAKVDEVLRDFGFAMGRFQVGDLSGNDVWYKVRQARGLTNKQQPAGAHERERFAVD